MKIYGGDSCVWGRSVTAFHLRHSIFRCRMGPWGKVGEEEKAEGGGRGEQNSRSMRVKEKVESKEESRVWENQPQCSGRAYPLAQRLLSSHTTLVSLLGIFSYWFSYG